MREHLLSQEEMKLGAHLGVDRLLGVLKPGTVAHWKRNIEGALAEVAAAGILGIDFVPTINTFHTVGDLAGDLEVRWTKHRSGALLVRENDELSRIFILVTGRAPVYRFPGWATGAEVLDRGNEVTTYRTRMKVWGMPQDKLHPIEDLTR